LRVQGIYVSSKEIERVTLNVKIQAPANYVDEIISQKVAQQKVQGIPESDLGDVDDADLYQQAIEVIGESRKASASLLQRRLKVGYARAARMLDMMEENGLIGPVNGAKAREIYID
jgi:S-DNA-T family DNA segregation ATPase FtsK/SpoIIIE